MTSQPCACKQAGKPWQPKNCKFFPSFAHFRSGLPFRKNPPLPKTFLYSQCLRPENPHKHSSRIYIEGDVGDDSDRNRKNFSDQARILSLGSRLLSEVESCKEALRWCVTCSSHLFTTGYRGYRGRIWQVWPRLPSSPSVPPTQLLWVPCPGAVPEGSHYRTISNPFRVPQSPDIPPMVERILSSRAPFS